MEFNEITYLYLTLKIVKLWYIWLSQVICRFFTLQTVQSWTKIKQFETKRILIKSYV